MFPYFSFSFRYGIEKGFSYAEGPLSADSEITPFLLSSQENPLSPSLSLSIFFIFFSETRIPLSYGLLHACLHPLSNRRLAGNSLFLSSLLSRGPLHYSFCLRLFRRFTEPPERFLFCFTDHFA